MLSLLRHSYSGGFFVFSRVSALPSFCCLTNVAQRFFVILVFLFFRSFGFLPALRVEFL